MYSMMVGLITYDMVIEIIAWKDLTGKDKGFKNTQEYETLKKKVFWVIKVHDVLGIIITLIRISEPRIMDYILKKAKRMWVTIRNCKR
jgi:hypothetical protein